MGSTSTHREKGLTDKEFFQNELGTNRTILACTTKRTYGEWQSVFYAAVRDDLTGEVWAFVSLIIRTRGYFNFTFKDMDETSGPAEAEAPAAILDLLTPTEHEYAIQWRARCRENIAAKAARPKVAKGDTVTFTHPLRFSNGVEAATFTLVERTTFRAANGMLVRIPAWRDRDHKLASA